jgi:hypothetical protein
LHTVFNPGHQRDIFLWKCWLGDSSPGALSNKKIGCIAAGETFPAGQGAMATAERCILSLQPHTVLVRKPVLLTPGSWLRSVLKQPLERPTDRVGPHAELTRGGWGWNQQDRPALPSLSVVMWPPPLTAEPWLYCGACQVWPFLSLMSDGRVRSEGHPAQEGVQKLNVVSSSSSSPASTSTCRQDGESQLCLCWDGWQSTQAVWLWVSVTASLGLRVKAGDSGVDSPKLLS